MSQINNDIHIGAHETIQWVDFDATNSELFDVDHILGKYDDFWLSLQLECVAECCGLDAFRFYPEDIANASKQYEQTPLKEDLLRLRKEVMETDRQIVVSRCLNNLVEKTVFVKLLDHIYKFLICMIVACIPWTAMVAQGSGYADGRPAATKRIACVDEGVVLKFGDGPDSCDTYGAREAIVNKEGKEYYLFYDGAGKDGWKACLAPGGPALFAGLGYHLVVETYIFVRF